MPKTVKFRFVKLETSNPNQWKIQIKGWFSWKYFGFWAGSCSGHSVWNVHFFNNQEDAIATLKSNEDSKSVVYIEYPSIKFI